MRVFRLRSCLSVLVLLLWPAAALAQSAVIEAGHSAGTGPLAHVASGLPLTFVPNAGHVDPRVRYHAKGRGFTAYFTADAAVVTLVDAAPRIERVSLSAPSGPPDRPTRGAAIGLRFLDASPDAVIRAGAKAAGTVSYLKGNDPAAWRAGLSTYRTIIYSELWPGIDLVFHGETGMLKYDLVVQPGASIDAIRLAYAGADAVTLDDAGNLRIATPVATVVDEAPVSYQTIDGRRVPVDVRTVLGARRENGDTPFGFAVRSAYDARLPLVIDPGLEFSTYLGGSAQDFATGLAVDPAGNIYVTGGTASLDFPATLGAFDATFNGGTSDVFVAKLAPAGDQLVWATYLGGSQLDRPLKGPALDGDGNIYVTGQTTSTNFPTTPGAFDRTFTSVFGSSDCFVVKLAPAGDQLVFSTYLGGSLQDGCFAVAVDSAQNVYVAGATQSSNFPTTAGAFDPTDNVGDDAFVTKFTAAGDALIYSTYLGGNAPTSGQEDPHGILVDSSGRAHVVGSTDSPDFPTTAGAYDTTHNGALDVFVATLSGPGDQLVVSTFLGGSGTDHALGMALDGAGDVYVAGQTSSTDFPTTPGAFDGIPNGGTDGYVVKLPSARDQLVYSTLLGSTGLDRVADVEVDAAGNAHVTGSAGAADFPVTAGSFDETFNGVQDAFFAALAPAGDQLRHGTFLGGLGSDGGEGIALDGAGNAYLTGFTSSTDFPTTAGAFDQTYNGGVTDAFVAKFSPLPPLAPQTREDCMNGGWQQYGFPNQGLCIRFVNTGQ